MLLLINKLILAGGNENGNVVLEVMDDVSFVQEVSQLFISDSIVIESVIQTTSYPILFIPVILKSNLKALSFVFDKRNFLTFIILSRIETLPLSNSVQFT